jgi:integrase
VVLSIRLGNGKALKRDTFASLIIAAGVNAKALSTYMGHASITITLDRYGRRRRRGCSTPNLARATYDHPVATGVIAA